MPPPKQPNKWKPAANKSKVRMTGHDAPPTAVPERDANEEREAVERLRNFNSLNVPKPKSGPSTASQLFIQPRVAFYAFFVAHLVAAFYAPIQDCDEVFNFYEPTHYLTHGYGLQTWEYSPEYAIRSWAYVSLHGAVMSLGRLIAYLLPFVPTKVAEFYVLRAALGAVCALCEARLYDKIAKTFNPRVAVLFVVIMLTSPGMFHASVSYLPSAFSMYTTMLGMAAFMDWRGGLRTAQGIWAIGSGALLGWPFAAAMVIPFALEEVLLADMSLQIYGLAKRVLDGSARVLIVAGLQGCIDGFFYKKVVTVPFNIVWYNVIAAREGKGPNIYGTEPWHFYIRNLVINFNLWFLIALASMPLVLYQHFVRRQPTTKQSWIRGVVFLSPFYLWLAIFTVQPHKEERFMYPAYPALALNAAVGVHLLLANIGSTTPGSLISVIPIKLRAALVTFLFMAAVNIGLWRSLGMATAYGAPLTVYKPLQQPGISRSGDTVCLGKEWYRFPSSFHLPDGVKAKFVKSQFSGLLPGEFSEAKGFGLFPGAHLIPIGMNDENKEDLSKYVSDLLLCYLDISG